MTIAEILLQDYDVEISNTRRTLERVPEDRPDWVPHPKSMKMGKLAMHCALLPNFGYWILEDDGMDLANRKRPMPTLRSPRGKPVCKDSMNLPPSVEPPSRRPATTIWPRSGSSALASI